jgi:hypothetical protein
MVDRKPIATASLLDAAFMGRNIQKKAAPRIRGSAACGTARPECAPTFFQEVPDDADKPAGSGAVAEILIMICRPDVFARSETISGDHRDRAGSLFPNGFLAFETYLA